jgi:hypothetical protein
VEAFGVLIKFKMADVAMVTKVQFFFYQIIFCTLVTMAVAAILNFFNPQKLPHTTVDIPTKFRKV